MNFSARFLTICLATASLTYTYANAELITYLDDQDIVIDMTLAQDVQVTSHLRLRADAASTTKYLLPSLPVHEVNVIHGDDDIICAFYERKGSEPAGNVRFGPSRQPSERTATFDPPLTNPYTLECERAEE